MKCAVGDRRVTPGEKKPPDLGIRGRPGLGWLALGRRSGRGFGRSVGNANLWHVVDHLTQANGAR